MPRERPQYFELTQTFRIEASHQLHDAPSESKCARLHGHSWEIEVRVSGAVDEERGWVIDYGEIEDAWEPLHERLDHRHLNDVEGLDNPTSEMLAAWIWERLEPRLEGLLCIVVHETCTSRCAYFGPAPRADAGDRRT